MTINARIKEIRQCIGLTQSKFAERIAISTSYLGEIEYGVKAANERILRLLIAEYNVDELWLRSGRGDMFKKGVDAQVSKIISMFKSLDKNFQLCALTQMEALTDLNSSTKENKHEDQITE